MAAILPLPYLVRPSAEVARRFPDAWFGRPHVWYLPSPGDHDYPGQQRLYEAELELAVLAEIRDEALSEPVAEVLAASRRSAAMLFEWKPSARFDELFTLERLGMSHHFDPERLAKQALTAVLPEATADRELPTRRGSWSLREAWARRIEARDDACALVLAALRHVVPRLLELHASELEGRGCRIGGYGDHVPPREAREALERELALRADGRRVLFVQLDRFEQTEPARVDIDYAIRRGASEPGRNRRVAGGKVVVELAHADGAWRVTHSTLVAHDRRPL